MKKIKAIFYVDNYRETLGDYATGLIFKLEDGTFLKALTTDVIKPFEVIEHNTDSEPCWCDPKVIEEVKNGNKVIVHNEAD